MQRQKETESERNKNWEAQMSLKSDRKSTWIEDR